MFQAALGHSWTARLAPHGLEAWKEVLKAGWEGLVAKDPERNGAGSRSGESASVTDDTGLVVGQHRGRLAVSGLAPGLELETVTMPDKKPRWRVVCSCG